jgi:lipopolysaccharide/colanic/teichoic acid biosynthesis glycosyltransferase
VSWASHRSAERGGERRNAIEHRAWHGFTPFRRRPPTESVASTYRSMPVLHAPTGPSDQHPALDARQQLAVEVWTRPRTRYERLFKPVIEGVAAAILLVVALPVLLVVALLVRLRLGSPVFFVQDRVGKGGEPFRMLKFRTMQRDRRDPAGRCYEGPERRCTHKSPNDPRHTSLGRFLRRSKLDELPQLVHVLTGRMSLVGPRPELAEVVATRYEPWQHARHVVRPGITGLWQVTSEADVHGRMHLATDVDLRYILSASPVLDLQIVVATMFRRFVKRMRRIATEALPG